MATPVWQDRRGMFQKGKEVHQPSQPTRRPSESSGGVAVSGVMDAIRRSSVSSNSELDKTTSNVSAGSPPPSSVNQASGRRRSSNTGLFGGLASMKRGSDDYGDRRASHDEGQQATGAFGGWFNKTFKQYNPQSQQATAQAQQPSAMQGGNKDDRRGVME